MNLLVTLLTTAFLQTVATAEAEYDPSASLGKVTVTDAEFEYGSDGRKVPLKLYLPEFATPAPVILFSHGLGGSRAGNGYLGNHWAGRGYAVVVMQHAGSDSAIWQGVPLRQRMEEMKAAASFENLQARVNDVAATLDQLTKWNAEDGMLKRRFDLAKVGMSGHSFGAVTTQAVSGQNYGPLGQKYTDDRIKAAVAFSPSPPAMGNMADTFARVRIPWLLMTGTKDESMVSRTTPEARRKVFAQLPAANHFYEVVLFEAEHNAFSDTNRIQNRNRNPNHHKVILALSSAFWDTYLAGKPEAKSWLNGPAARTLQQDKDVWNRK